MLVASMAVSGLTCATGAKNAFAGDDGVLELRLIEMALLILLPNFDLGGVTHGVATTTIEKTRNRRYK